MSIETGQSVLNHSLKELYARWAVTQQSWRDETSRAFEANHLAPLEANTRKAVEAMSQMATILNRLRRDCE